MDDRSVVANRTAASDLGNIRDDEHEDDDEFFARNNSSDDSCKGGENDEQICSLAEPKSSMRHDSYGQSADVTKSTAITGDFVSGLKENLPPLRHNAASRRFPISELTKITEVPDEASFSFKNGDSMVHMLEHHHEAVAKEDLLRIPDGSFHASQYSMKYSWEESALRHQNSTFMRPELDLSKVQIKGDGGDTQSPTHSDQSDQIRPSDSSSSNCQQKRTRTTSFRTNSIVEGTFSSCTIAGRQPKRAFISGTRFAVYFGFRRIGVDAEETLTIHNVHPEGERMLVSCRLKNESRSNCFKVVNPPPKSNILLNRNQYLRIVISFLPREVGHFENIVYVECQSRNEKQEFMFLVHGFGGRAVVEPCLQERPGSLFLSTNGHYQLMVRTLSKFQFSLENKGKRAAFASIFVYGSKGEMPRHSVWVNQRNIVLKMKGRDDDKGTKIQQNGHIKTIEIQFHGELDLQPATRQQQQTIGPSISASIPTDSPEGIREPALKIVIFWGEERLRQRLKTLEKKVGARLKMFEHDFTMQPFSGENGEWLEWGQKEKHVSEEEFFYFNSTIKLIFVDVHLRGNALMQSRAGSSCSIGQQLRAGSALSIASTGVAPAGSEGGGRLEMRSHQTIVEMDPDNTLRHEGNALWDTDDDTLT